MDIFEEEDRNKDLFEITEENKINPDGYVEDEDEDFEIERIGARKRVVILYIVKKRQRVI